MLLWGFPFKTHGRTHSAHTLQLPPILSCASSRASLFDNLQHFLLLGSLASRMPSSHCYFWQGSYSRLGGRGKTRLTLCPPWSPCDQFQAWVVSDGRRFVLHVRVFARAVITVRTLCRSPLPPCNGTKPTARVWHQDRCCQELLLPNEGSRLQSEANARKVRLELSLTTRQADSFMIGTSYRMAGGHVFPCKQKYKCPIDPIDILAIYPHLHTHSLHNSLQTNRASQRPRTCSAAPSSGLSSPFYGSSAPSCACWPWRSGTLS